MTFIPIIPLLLSCRYLHMASFSTFESFCPTPSAAENHAYAPSRTSCLTFCLFMVVKPAGFGCTLRTYLHIIIFLPAQNKTIDTIKTIRALLPRAS
ncbi:hypothetical protein EV426DRAFT_627303, partial [Tirmania nivea]